MALQSKELNEFLKKHMPVIRAFAHKYHNGYDYDDFVQELSINVVALMNAYDKNRNDSPDAYFLCCLDSLSVKTLNMFNRDKSLQILHTATDIPLDMPTPDHEIAELDIREAIEQELTPFEKHIVYSIDFKVFDRVNYAEIASSMGMTSRMFYYYLNIIREKLKKRLELD